MRRNQRTSHTLTGGGGTGRVSREVLGRPEPRFASLSHQNNRMISVSLASDLSTYLFSLCLSARLSLFPVVSVSPSPPPPSMRPRP